MSDSIDDILLEREIPATSEATYRKGLWFIHHDGENRIQVWGSNFNGREKVYLNNELVSEERSMAKSNIHHFKDKNDVNYSVEISVESIRRGPLICKIKRGDEILKTFTAKYAVTKSFKPLKMIGGLVLIFLIALILQLLKKFYALSDWIFVPYFILTMFFVLSTYTQGKITIEEA